MSRLLVEPHVSDAYSASFKVLACAITGGVGLWFFSMIVNGNIGSINSTGVGWLSAAVVLMGWTLWNFFSSKTTLTTEKLHQSWIWDKEIALNDMAYAKLIRARGFRWLIAPRLYVRTVDGKFAVFYAAEEAMILQFENITSQLTAQKLTLR